ncbi:MAG: hypothetical protein J6J33_00950 [Clostridia bacterium]|nr:hypothetical protein [Clostridia bacterium]
MKKVYSFLICFVLFLIPFALSGCKDNNNNPPATITRTKGVWWWDKGLDDTYLEFAAAQSINEIYYCDSALDENTKKFVKKAKSHNIKTYLLAGEYQWLYDDSNLITLIDKYVSYNSNNPDAKLAGIHLDIEPHQAEDFDSNRESLVKSLILIAKKLKNTYPDIEFSYDIPFWFEQDLEIDGETKKEFEWIFDYADKVFVMSYRDTAEKIISVAQAELNYAKEKNKTIFLSVETKDLGEENNIVTFYEEGFDALVSALKSLDKTLPKNAGLSIHHIKSLKILKDK